MKPGSLALFGCLLSLATFGCVPHAQVHETGDATGTIPGSDLSTAVLATVSEDYATGALATIDFETLAVTDQIVDISGDPAVVAAGGFVFQLDRFNYDTVRIYAPGQWSQPLHELALEDLANPQDVAVCGGLAFVSQYGLDSLAVIDPDAGTVTGAVDLSAYTDDDGIPEASSMVATEGRLYVGLQQMAREDGWGSAGGLVVEVDCEAMAVTKSWALASPEVYAATDGLIIHELGVGLHQLDPITGQLTGPVLTNDDVGAAIHGLAAFDDMAVVVTNVDQDDYAIGCVDMQSWTYSQLSDPDSYLPQIAGNSAGQAWVSVRTHWSNADGQTGALPYDIATCSPLTSGPIRTLLAPFSIAFY